MSNQAEGTICDDDKRNKASYCEQRPHFMRRRLKDKVRNYYTIYGKNDIVIASGSSEECARQLGITKPSFYTMVSKFQKGKQYQRYSAIVVDDEELTEQEEEDV